MAMGAGSGVVEQRDIDRIVASHVRRLESDGGQPGVPFHSSINPPYILRR